MIKMIVKDMKNFDVYNFDIFLISDKSTLTLEVNEVSDKDYSNICWIFDIAQDVLYESLWCVLNQNTICDIEYKIKERYSNMEYTDFFRKNQIDVYIK